MSLIFRTSLHLAKDIAIRLENVVFMGDAHNVETFEPWTIKPQGPTVWDPAVQGPPKPQTPQTYQKSSKKYVRIYCIFIRILKSFHFIFLLRDLLLAASLSAPGDGDGEDDDDEEEVDAHQDDAGGQDDLVVPLLCDRHILIFMFLLTQGQVTIILITRKDDPHERGRYFFRSLFYWQVLKIFALWDAAIFPWVSLSSKAPNTCDIGPWTPFFTL